MKQKSKVAIFWLIYGTDAVSPLHPKKQYTHKYSHSSTPILLYIIYCLSPHFFFQSEYVLHHSVFIRVGNRQTEWRIGCTFIQWGSGISLHVLNLKKMMASLSLALSLLQTCHLPCESCQHFSARRSTFIILHMQAHTSSSPLPFSISPSLCPQPLQKLWRIRGRIDVDRRLSDHENTESKQYSRWSSDFQREHEESQLLYRFTQIFS